MPPPPASLFQHKQGRTCAAQYTADILVSKATTSSFIETDPDDGTFGVLDCWRRALAAFGLTIPEKEPGSADLPFPEYLESF